MTTETTPEGRIIMQHAREIFAGGGGLTVTTGDNGSIDAFARFRTSEAVGLFDSQMQYDNSPLFWETSPATGTFATHLADESSVRLRVTGGQTVIRQTRSYHRYQPGKSQLILMTFVCATPLEGVYQRIGYFDAENGIYFQINDNDAGLDMVLRSNASGSTVETEVRQINWNLDTLNGSGPSGITLDITQSQIFLIDLEWLGVGRVRVGFVIDGIPVYCHEFLNANVNNTVYMTTANLPLRYEISATGGTPGTHDLIQICSQVSSEGGFEQERGIPFSASNGTTTISVNARRPVLSIRPAATFNSIPNRGQIAPEELSVYAATQSTYWELVYGGTLTSGTFNSVDATYSIVEVDKVATGITGGIVIASGYSAAGSGNPNQRGGGSSAKSILSKLPIALNIAGGHPTTPVTDILSIVCTTVPDSASETSAEMTWRELR